MENQSSAENIGGQVDHHGGRLNDECQEIVPLQQISQLLLVSQQKTWERPRIEKVPPQLRLRKEQIEHVYDPVMVSLGPYHHDRQELRKAEKFKYHCLDWCAGNDNEKKLVFYNKIVEKIAEIRECYAEVTIVEKYDDKALALMMLLDACFIINFVHNYLDMEGNNNLDWQHCLGAASVAFIFRDIMVLENQIPYQVLKLLISLKYEKKEAEGFLQRFLSASMDTDLNHAEIPEEIEGPPIHFLEAYWRVMTKPINETHGRVYRQLASKFQWPRFLREVHILESLWTAACAEPMVTIEEIDIHEISYTHRSVMDLKAKGIHFRSCSSPSLMNITFTSLAFYGQFQLPNQYVSGITPVLYSNMIAYEVSPNRRIAPVVLSYAVFLKSLIQSPEDVKELQDKGILLNTFANLEKVVKLFKEIDTFGFPIQDIFIDIKQKVEKHCKSKAKTWIAELIHTRFQTPWTAIALFAAVFLLCLTFLQTFFTIHPVKMK